MNSRFHVQITSRSPLAKAVPIASIGPDASFLLPFRRSMNASSSSDRRIGLSLTLALLLMVVVGSLAEGVLRWAFDGGRLPAGIVGTGNLSFDVTFHQAERFVVERGRPQILCLGSSMMKNAVDPETIERVSREVSGRSVSCFNFGVAGGDPVLSEQTLAAVQSELRPELILVEAIAPELHRPGVINLISKDIPQSPWYRYRSGEPVLDGFLIDRLLLHRYFLRFRLYLEDPKNFRRLAKQESRMRYDGFDTRNTPEGPESIERRTSSEAESGIIGDASVHLSALGRILARSDRVVVVEPPLDAGLRRSHSGGESGYLDALARIRELAERHGTRFVQATGRFEAPEDGWLNANHLNLVGSAAYSGWLVRQLAEAQLLGDRRAGVTQ
jgi:hypothetical protein